MSYDETHSIPELPEPGFYYHYKHDPEEGINDHAYEILPTVGFHTEDDCRPIDQFMVGYLPLYPSHIYLIGKGRLNDNRPLSLFMEPAEKGGQKVPRFTKIKDPLVIRALKKKKHEMYPHLA